MKKLTEIFEQKERTYSFELFPPKTEEGYQKLLKVLPDLCALKPDFVSVTYGAGGGNRARTLDIVDIIQKKYNTIGLAHLTCVLNTKNEIKDILNEVKKRGILNVLALRGDNPLDQPDWQAAENNFKYSCELCAFMRQEFGDYFCIGVAGFPEGHVLAPSKEADAEFLKKKIDEGADYVITQLFFENKDYFDYVKRLRALGITARVIPGILPIVDYSRLLNFCKTCGANIPDKVHKIFGPIKEDKQAMLKAGIDYAVSQCRDLLNKGAPGIHFYPLNRLEPIATILNQIRR